MTSINVAALINMLGFATGAVLYAMLLLMVFRHPVQPNPTLHNSVSTLSSWTASGLLLATAILGLLWNLGSLSTQVLKGLGITETSSILSAISYTALGFLPAVVVHSVLKGNEGKEDRRIGRLITLASYSLSAITGTLHFYSAVVSKDSPSLAGLRALTVGYVVLIIALFLTSRRQEGWQRAVGATALAVFAVSALHLSYHHNGESNSWIRELTGHQASLPLVLAILYQDYRFALADIFLKRALSLLSLVALAFGLYLLVAAPLMGSGGEIGQPGPRTVSVLLVLWVSTALLYPILRRIIDRFVDTVVLSRSDYGKLRANLAFLLSSYESPTLVLDEVCRVLGPALSAREVSWLATDARHSENGEQDESTLFAQSQVISELFANHIAELTTQTEARISKSRLNENVLLLERSTGASALVFIPTTEPPFYALVLRALSGGRRLLSDDIAMLDSIVMIVARRIDALRVTHERCEQSLREQEISKLATEAQLRALRAQVNPHFLFNALTTIGYLIQTAPDRATETLMKLTSLLRGVLRTTDDFFTLGQELDLIASYLDIERARFEERLRVRVDIPEPLLAIRLPSLMVQPLVENAIKHGIAPARFGGEVSISARLEPALTGYEPTDKDVLCIMVSDTGVGASEMEIARGRKRGVGLRNIEERLHCYSGDAASLRITSTPGSGTVVYLRIPVSSATVLHLDSPKAPIISIAERRGA
jgi:two-component system LytT family sensor kinase